MVLSMDYSLVELGLVGATLYFSDFILTPLMATSTIMEMLKFGLQALAVLWVDAAYKKG